MPTDTTVEDVALWLAGKSDGYWHAIALLQQKAGMNHFDAEDWLERESK